MSHSSSTASKLPNFSSVISYRLSHFNIATVRIDVSLMAMACSSVSRRAANGSVPHAIQASIAG